MKKRKKATESMAIQFILNGYEIAYSRVEYDDGSCDETGLPAGMKPRPSMTDLAAYAMRASGVVRTVRQIRSSVVATETSVRSRSTR